MAKTPFLIGLGAYLSGAHFQLRTVGATMALLAGLWTALYALNEATDVAIERELEVPYATRGVLALIILLVLLAACATNRVLIAPMSLTLLSQAAYSLPPLRVKRWWWAALGLSGVANPLLRFYCGALWGVHSIPPYAFATVILVHIGAAARARSLLRDRDARLGYLPAPTWITWVGVAATAGGMIGAYVMCWQGLLPRVGALILAPCVAFAAYAWSHKSASMADLRRGWIGFAVLAAIAICILLVDR